MSFTEGSTVITNLNTLPFLDYHTQLVIILHRKEMSALTTSNVWLNNYSSCILFKSGNHLTMDRRL